jgi:hypothetical protein
MKSLKSQSVCALLKGWVVQSATTPATTFGSSSWYWSTQVVTSATTLGSSSWSTLQWWFSFERLVVPTTAPHRRTSHESVGT